MLRYLVSYAVSALAFVALDVCWLSFAGQRFYRPILGDLLADKVSVAPAIAFYAIYIAGVQILAVAPGWSTTGWSRTALLAAALGLVAYGTYDLTNQATLRAWATRITLMDMAWGAFATVLAALAGLWAARAISGSPS